MLYQRWVTVLRQWPSVNTTSWISGESLRGDGGDYEKETGCSLAGTLIAGRDNCLRHLVKPIATIAVDFPEGMLTTDWRHFFREIYDDCPPPLPAPPPLSVVIAAILIAVTETQCSPKVGSLYTMLAQH